MINALKVMQRFLVGWLVAFILLAGGCSVAIFASCLLVSFVVLDWAFNEPFFLVWRLFVGLSALLGLLGGFFYNEGARLKGDLSD